LKTLSLARITLIAIATIGVAVMLAAAGLYRVTSVEIASVRSARDQLMAQQVAQQVAAKVEFQRSILSQFAQMKEVIAVAADENQQRRQQVTDRLQRFLPHVWKLRLVSANFQSTEPNATPPIGYADLDLINYSSSQGEAPAAVAGEGGTPRARIVFVQPVFAAQEERVVGHLLLAVRFSLVDDLVAQLTPGGGYVELQQTRRTGEQQVLVAGGDQALASTSPYISKVAGSQWQVAFWPAQEAQSGDSRLALFIGVAAVVVLIAGIALWLLGRRWNRAVTADLVTLVTMVRDARAGDLKSTYPAQAAEIVGTVYTVREELSHLRRRAVKPKLKSRPKPAPKAASTTATPPVDDTPDIDLDLD